MYPVMLEGKKERYSIRWGEEYLKHWGIWRMLERFLSSIAGEARPSPLLGWVTLISVRVEPIGMGLPGYELHFRAEVWVPFD